MNATSRMGVTQRAFTVIGAMLLAAVIGGSLALLPVRVGSQDIEEEGAACDSQACDTYYKVCMNTDIAYNCKETSNPADCKSTPCKQAP